MTERGTRLLIFFVGQFLKICQIQTVKRFPAQNPARHNGFRQETAHQFRKTLFFASRPAASHTRQMIEQSVRQNSLPPQFRNARQIPLHRRKLPEFRSRVIKSTVKQQPSANGFRLIAPAEDPGHIAVNIIQHIGQVAARGAVAPHNDRIGKTIQRHSNGSVDGIVKKHFFPGKYQ